MPLLPTLRSEIVHSVAHHHQIPVTAGIPRSEVRGISLVLKIFRDRFKFTQRAILFEMIGMEHCFNTVVQMIMY